MKIGEERIDNILNIISKKLESVNYAFIGSVNMYIQGLKVNPRDIDILTTPEDIKKIDKIFSKYRTKEIYYDKSEKKDSFRSFYVIDNKEIEVLGNVNNICRSLKSLDKKIYLKFNGIKLPCISLIDEMSAYKKMGHEKKVKMIKNFLQTSK